MTVLLVCSCAIPPPPRTFSVDLKSPNCEAGNIEAYFDRYLSIGSLKKNPVSVFYYPKEDAVCLQFKVQYISCKQFWDKTGRDAFTAAFKRYQEEFEQKKLSVKGRKGREVYGKVPGYFMWKKTPVSLQAYGNPEFAFGYQFKDDAVFFTATQTESRYEDPISRDRSETSPVLVLYFTRTQAESLIALFDREHLQGLAMPAVENDGVYTELDGY